MKIKFILYCVAGSLFSTVAAHGETKPLNPSQEKAAAVVMESATWNSASTYYDGDAHNEGWVVKTMTGNYTRTSGGSQTAHLKQDNEPWGEHLTQDTTDTIATNLEITLNHVKGHNQTGSFETYATNCGYVSIVKKRGSLEVHNSYSAYNVPLVESEGGDVCMMLHTGGKSLSHRPSLFALSGSATERVAATQGWFTRYRVIADGPEVPSVQITVDGGHLGADGVRWRVYPDNSDDTDVTPSTGRPLYIIGVGQGKYTPHIAANDIDLTTTTNPTFCVGQALNFVLNFSPSQPPYVNMLGSWSLPGKFVNHKWQNSITIPPPDGSGVPEPFGSVNYDIDNSLLQNTNSTSCWYQNTPGGKISVSMNLLLSNGQFASIAADGSFIIYRPTAEITRTNTPFYFTLLNTNFLRSELSLGDSDGYGSMEYRVTVHSKYFGHANITQLITAGCSNPFYNFSDERCDGAPPYNLTPTVVYDDGTSGLVPLDDGPQQTWEDSNTVSIHARDFVQFCPGGSGSIYVTLGIVKWDASATATQYSMYGEWFIKNYPTITGPNGPDGSDEFPVWTKIQSAH